MSEETTNDGTWSSLKKTIIATLTTLIAGGGTWLGVQLFNGGHEENEEPKTEQTSSSQGPITINVQQNQENKQKTENNNSGGVVRERIIEKQSPASEPVKPQPKPEEESW